MFCSIALTIETLAESSTSPPSSPQSSSTVDSPINLPEVVVEDHKVVYDVEPLLTFVRNILNGPCLPLKTIHGVRYAPLQRFHMAFYHLFDGKRPTVIRETNLINMTMVIREMETVIQRSAKFLMSCEEFCGLPASDKWEMLRRFSSKVMFIVRAVSTVEFFGFDVEDKRVMYTADVCLYADTFDYDTEQVPTATAEALKKIFRPLMKNMLERIIIPFKQFRITKFEAVYLLAIMLWSVENINNISAKTHEVAERFMSEAASELHHYYRFEMKVENYAERLTRLIKMINSIEKMSDQRQELLTLLNTFELFSCDLFNSEYFI
uniref:NR LBD domain-containing protein n=1 Tax=Steinernema glaseri TaxID=37863 RepID=A0A1I7YR63_9BILA